MSHDDTTEPDGIPLTERPVGLVVVETPLAHLDRPFEYLVPEDLRERALPGVRVKVPFAGRALEGFLVERRAVPEHNGRLAPIRTVVSDDPVLSPELLAMCRAVADRYAGTLADVLRLAIPRRHATAEKALDARAAQVDDESQGSPAGASDAEPEPQSESPVEPLAADDMGPWAVYPAGPALLRRIAAGEAPGAAWLAGPGASDEGGWPDALAHAAASAVRGGRGALLVVPDQRDLDRLDAAMTRVLGKDRHVRLTAEQGPQARYTAWLKARRGLVPVVIGTRAAMFAPVRDLGLVAWWDDGDDLHEEPRAPYPSVGVVLRLRAKQHGAAVIAAGHALSVRVGAWVAAGELALVSMAPDELARRRPRVTVAGEGTDIERDGPAARAHLPSRAWRAAHDALAHGPVLVQVPRRGYRPSLTCGDCRTPARCPRCQGPVAMSGPGMPPECRWCAWRPEHGFSCSHCGGTRLRAAVTGARRSAEEMGRAFPGVPVYTSGAGAVRASVEDKPALVVATPGAEPVAEGGYAAVLLLDAWALLDLPVLDSAGESLRRWLNAAALARPGAPVVIGGAPEGLVVSPIEALVRWDPAWLAAREVAERAELGLPPTSAMARLSGPRRALADGLRELEPLLPVEATVLGPFPGAAGAERGRSAAGSSGAQGPPDDVVLVRSPLAERPEVCRALAAMRAVRSARKEEGVVTVRVDPTDAL